MADEQSNYEWFLEAIDGAKSIERLDMLAHDIKIDKAAGVDYTTDETQLNTIRQRWANRYQLLKDENAA